MAIRINLHCEFCGATLKKDKVYKGELQAEFHWRRAMELHKPHCSMWNPLAEIPLRFTFKTAARTMPA